VASEKSRTLHVRFLQVHTGWQSGARVSCRHSLGSQSVRPLSKPPSRGLPCKVTRHGRACMNRPLGRIWLASHTYRPIERSPECSNNSALGGKAQPYFLGRIKAHKSTDWWPR
jgi:hypothetical protein